MGETPSKLDFFNVYDWLVCNIDTELREPALGHGEYMRLYLRSDPPDCAKGLILKYLVDAEPGMPEYLIFKHPGILEKCLKDKVEWLPFAAKSLGVVLLEAKNKLIETGIPLYRNNDNDICNLKSLRLLQAEYPEPEEASMFLNLQRNAILQKLVNKPQNVQASIDKLFYDDRQRILFLDGKRKYTLTPKEQKLFEYLKGDDYRDVSDICDHMEYTDRKSLDPFISTLNRKTNACFGFKVIENPEKGMGKYSVSGNIKNMKFKKPR